MGAKVRKWMELIYDLKVSQWLNFCQLDMASGPRFYEIWLELAQQHVQCLTVLLAMLNFKVMV
jgi:hypothetical protein